MPAEMLPAHINYRGVEFNLAPAKTGSPNAVVAKGQTIHFPAGHFNRVYILAASADGDQTASFRVGEKSVSLNIQDWSGFIGQWDTRIWKDLPHHDWAISANHAVWPPPDMAQREKPDTEPKYPDDYIGLKAGYIKPAGLAWYASHHHTADGLNEPYQYSYLFAYSVGLAAGDETLTLPDNSKIRILAISVAQVNPELTPAQPLFDHVNRTEPPQAMEAALPWNPSSAAGLSRKKSFLRNCAATATLTSLPILGGWNSGKRGPASRTISLDNDWLFAGKLDDSALPHALDALFNDSTLPRITLPHCVTPLSWQKWDPAAWQDVWLYRRHFKTPDEPSPHRVFLHFDRVMTNATLALNGHSLDPHVGGYLPFQREITGFIQESNALAVEVDSRFLPVPPAGNPKGPHLRGLPAPRRHHRLGASPCSPSGLHQRCLR